MDSSGSQEKKSIPRFASFKPSPAPTPEADRPAKRPKHDPSERALGRHERSRHHSSRHSRHRSHSHRSRSRERRTERRDHRHARAEADTSRGELAPAPPSSQTSSLKPSKDDATDLYMFDSKGDKYNVIYGTIHRYNVPRYRRFGRGSVLGLPPRYKIDRDTAEGDAVIIRTGPYPDGSRIKAKNILAGLRKQQTKLLRVRQVAGGATVTGSEDYLSLGDVSNKGKDFEDAGSDDEKYAYRSIRGKAKPEDMIPSDLEAVSDSDSGDEGARADPDKYIRQRNAELSRGVEQRPTDVGAWLRLIDHQESLLRGSEREPGTLTNAERKSLADIKLSIYEKALKQLGQTSSRDQLLLGFLEEGAKLWDTKKLSAQWQSILKSNSHFISLWVKYLDFRQTEFLDFTYEKCLATFMDCLRLNKSSPDHPKKADVQIYLFLRLTLFVREAGFMEHAVGLWQAILELALQTGCTDDDRLSSFLEFWDSEVARIGEPRAKGWQSGQNTLPESCVFSPQARITPNSLIPSWVRSERERITRSRLPARSLDDEEDPYCVILASDLQEVLPLVLGFGLTDVLIDAFLSFCHLPPILNPVNAERISSWTGDGFLRNHFMNSPDYTLDDWLSKTLPNPLSFPHQNFIHTTSTLFATGLTWFYSLSAWVKAAVVCQSDIDPAWTRRVLRSLVDAMPQNDDLAEYALAVEFACNAKEAKKYAKSLLKKRSSNLRLYNAYALMERRSGNHAAADHVWSTSLSMSSTFSEYNKVDSILLWHTWLWELLEARNMAHASHILTSMPQNSIDLKAFPDPADKAAFSPTTRLKIQSFLSQTLESLLANRKATGLTACVDSQAILSYLTHSFDLNNALESYSSAISRLSTLPNNDASFIAHATEHLHQSRARFLYYHVQIKGVYKPSHIRSLLTESISSFPHNTMFLSLFALNETRFRIDERVRDVIRDITAEKRHRDTLTQPQTPITSHLFSIYTEMNRPVFAGSTVHSVRAAFEKAIGEHDTSPTQHISTLSTARSNLTLWKLYVLFELSHHDILRATDIFYRGMRACPWSKELIMLAFSHLRADVVQTRHAEAVRRGNGMDFDELRRVYNVLVEKELRIHVDIEDELDESMEKMQQSAVMGLPFDMPVDAESEDEAKQG